MQLFQESVEVPGEILESREIPSDLALVSPLVVRLVSRLEDEGLVGEDRLMKVRLCFDEAVTNAVKHGNKNDFEKMVHVWLFLDKTAWGLIVSDEGEGFKIEDLAAAQATPEENLWRENGRGLPLMSLYMDECAYYEGGSTLVLKQYLTRSE